MNKIVTFAKFFMLIFITTMLLLLDSWLFLIGCFIVSSFFIFKFKSSGILSLPIYPLIFMSLSIMCFQLILNNSFALQERFFLGLFAAMRIVTISFFVFIFSAITSVNDIIEALDFLPRRFQLLLTMTFALIPVFIDEIRKIKLVQSSRGSSWRNFKSLIVPLLHRSLYRAEQISVRLVCHLN